MSDQATVASKLPISSVATILGVVFCLGYSMIVGDSNIVAAIFAVLLVLGLISSVGDTAPPRWAL